MDKKQYVDSLLFAFIQFPGTVLTQTAFSGLKSEPYHARHLKSSSIRDLVKLYVCTFTNLAESLLEKATLFVVLTFKKQAKYFR